MPRVVHLAETSSDRQTKVSAGELLHSVVLVLLGKGTQNMGQDQVRLTRSGEHCQDV
jgi:DNA-dependent protein kinase catalytic subunit